MADGHTDFTIKSTYDRKPQNCYSKSRNTFSFLPQDFPQTTSGMLGQKARASISISVA
jgi:hypothetical protein